MARPKIIDEFSHIACRFARSRARLKERRKKQWREAYAKNPEPNKLRVKAWQKANPEKVKMIRARSHRNRLLHDPNYRIAQNQRSRIYAALMGAKDEHTDFLIGGVAAFRERLESLWKAGWSWDNYGEVWEIDHIRPLDSFNLRDSEEQRIAFHYSNVQPLSKEDNRRKGAKWER